MTQTPSNDREVGVDEANPPRSDELAPSDRASSSPPHTGDPAVDAALARAAAVQGADPADQLETYVGTHRALQDRLADSGA